MKKYLFIVLVLVMASIAFMGCQDTGVTPEPVEPPVVPPTFVEVVGGEFWTLDRVEKYQDTGARNGAPIADPFALNICSYWDDEGNIWFYDDSNEDGIISPSEPVAGPVTWEVIDDQLYVGGNPWDISYFDGEGWAIEGVASGIDFGDGVDNEYGDWDGWVRFHYVPCDKWFDGDVMTHGFSFVFDDMYDSKYAGQMRVIVSAHLHEWYKCVELGKGCKKQHIHYLSDVALHTISDWIGYVESDNFDAMGFTYGGNDVFILNFNNGFSVVITAWIDEDEEVVLKFGVGEQFIAGIVYDMDITVDSADAALFEFEARTGNVAVIEHAFSVETMLDRSQLAEMVPVYYDDVDYPVVAQM